MLCLKSPFPLRGCLMAKEIKHIIFGISHLRWDKKTIEEQIRLRIDALWDIGDGI